MVEEKKEYDNKPLVWKVLKYKGKELKKEDADGKWKLFTLFFESSGNFPLKISVFDGMGTKEGSKSLSLKELEEGDVYNIGWKESEYDHPQYGPQINRTAMCMKVSAEEPCFDLKPIPVAGDLPVQEKNKQFMPVTADDVKACLEEIKAVLDKKEDDKEEAEVEYDLLKIYGMLIRNLSVKMNGLYVAETKLDSLWLVFKVEYSVIFK